MLRTLFRRRVEVLADGLIRPRVMGRAWGARIAQMVRLFLYRASTVPFSKITGEGFFVPVIISPRLEWDPGN